jgi:hypothetical protein
MDVKKMIEYGVLIVVGIFVVSYLARQVEAIAGAFGGAVQGNGLQAGQMVWGYGYEPTPVRYGPPWAGRNPGGPRPRDGRTPGTGGY